MIALNFLDTLKENVSFIEHDTNDLHDLSNLNMTTSNNI